MTFLKLSIHRISQWNDGPTYKSFPQSSHNQVSIPSSGPTVQLIDYVSTPLLTYDIKKSYIYICMYTHIHTERKREKYLKRERHTHTHTHRYMIEKENPF